MICYQDVTIREQYRVVLSMKNPLFQSMIVRQQSSALPCLMMILIHFGSKGWMPTKNAECCITGMHQ